MAISLTNTGIEFTNGTQTTAVTYTWLNSNYFNTVINCGQNTPTFNCYGSGNILANVSLELVSSGGGALSLRSIGTYTNCNCVCDCNCDCTCT